MIKINTVQIISPTSYMASINDISKAERNANGEMVIERVATKRKLELAWNYLTQVQLSTLLGMVSGVFFTVEYPDPQDGALKTGTFYAGDRSAGAIDYQNGVVRWKDIKFNLIEK